MISRLKGAVVEIDGDVVVLDVRGVGYSVTCTASLLTTLAVDVEACITTHTDVKEDAIRIFGFESKSERRVFQLLTKVSGMGPRSAVDVLSNVPARDLLRAIGVGDVQALMKIKGVGKKKAERIVVELKDLVVSLGVEARPYNELVDKDASFAVSNEDSHVDAIVTLEVLGFSRRDAEAAVGRAVASFPQINTAGEVVREALKFV
jgi:Holliday junction DNA helicase RuvA